MVPICESAAQTHVTKSILANDPAQDVSSLGCSQRPHVGPNVGVRKA